MAEFCYREHHFPNAVSMANYILECDNQDRAKAEAEKQEKLDTEKKLRVVEVKNAYTEYVETCNKARENYLKIKNKYDKDYNCTTWEVNDLIKELNKSIMFRL